MSLATATAETGIPTVSPGPAHVLPFQVRAGHIILAGRINGALARLILDTGSSVSALDADWAAPLALPATGSPVAAMGTGTTTVTLATAQSITLGSLELRDQLVVLVPLDRASAQSGMPINGTIGHPLFARYVVEIDYARRELRLFEPASYTYAGSGTSVDLDLSRGIPIISATIVPRGGAPVDARLALDIGASGIGVLFTTPFVTAHAAAFEHADAIEMTGAVGFGGTLGGRIARLDRLDIGTLSIRAPIVALTRDGPGFFGVTWTDGAIGAPIFERTTLIFDYSRKRAILEPRGEMNAPFAYDASGVELTSDTDGHVLVSGVAPASPASEAGLQPDDVVISVDGHAATAERLDDIRASLRAPDGRPVFVVARDGRESRSMLALRTRI